ncbi:MAG TPA: hypothetical protein VLT16_02305 [Candidatus Limnocylindrales bacterium]|nr:hypothetical protein [Candidatus Limnocylindrales bacterium]
MELVYPVSPGSLKERRLTVIDLLKNFVFFFTRCWHLKRGPLITLRSETPRTGVAAITGTYCVCLGCGKQFAYDLETMRPVKPESAPMKSLVASAAGEKSS